MRAGRVAENPFYVLAVPPGATRMEIERAGQKLLGQLAIGIESSRTYRTPFGERQRDEASVRAALTTLRDPEERVLYELWAADAEGGGPPEPLPHWRDAFRSIGWRGRCTD